MLQKTVLSAAVVCVLAAACAQPDPRQLLSEMRQALRGVESVRYQMTFGGTGDQTSAWSTLSGSVVLRRLDLSGGRFLARVAADVERPDGDTDHVLGVRSETEVVLSSSSDRLTRRSSLFEAGSSLMARMEPALLYVVYDPESLSGDIEAESVLYEGSGEVAGEACALVRVGWVDDDEDARWCIGRDRFPRRLEWIEGDGANVLEIVNLEVEPQLPADTFSTVAPAGYEVEDVVYGPQPGSAAPPEPLRTGGGEAITLADLAGEVLVLDFWATWCPPCLSSLRGLDELVLRFGGRPVRFLAVNAMEADAAKASAFFDEHGFSSELLLAGDEVHRFYVKGSLPGSAVLDASGRLVGVSIGYHGDGSREHLAGLIEKALSTGR